MICELGFLCQSFRFEQINNKCKASVPIELVKICELEGEIRQKEKPKEDVKKDKKGKHKPKKKGKGKKEKAKKIIKYSKELSEDEIYSLENFFCAKEGKFYKIKYVRLPAPKAFIIFDRQLS